MRRIVALTALILFGVAIGAARAELKVGDNAPPLAISKWVKGKPVNLADGKGKNIYVVEFWATWCSPCVRSIPHLTKLAKHFEKSNVVFVGVSIDATETVAKVEPFVKDMGSKMEYVVGIDDGMKSNQAYLEAAGAEGIPHAFIVGKDGKIAWHGHPMDEMGGKLAELTGDKAFAEAEKTRSELNMKFGIAFNEEKWDDALAAAEKLLAVDPEESQFYLLRYYILSVKKKDAEGAAKVGKDVLQKVENADFLSELAWRILVDENFGPTRDKDLALKAAQKAKTSSKGEVWQVLDTLAKALHETGDSKKAAEEERQAIALATKGKVEETTLKELKENLEKYEKAPAK